MIDAITLLQYRTLINTGLSQRQACEKLGIARSTLQDAIRSTRSNSLPKIKVLDIETSPSITAAFGRFNQNIQQDAVMHEGGTILTACVKDLGGPVRRYAVNVPSLWDDHADEIVTKALYQELETADVVIGHHLDGFDIPIIRTRGLFHGLGPCRTVKTIDTRKIAKRLRFNSNKLDSIAAYLGLGRKVKHDGIRLWLDVMQMKPGSIQKMLEYNEQDVLLTEDVYEKLKAFDKRPPSMALYTGGEEVCPVCGSHDLEETGNRILTSVSVFEEIKCNECGHRMRTRENQIEKPYRNNIKVSTGG